MAKKSFTITGMFFETKTALVEYVKKILHSSPHYQYLTPADFEFMLEILKFHPRYKQKAGCGIAALYVKPNPIYPTLGFWIVRTDGSETDFSYKECFNVSTQRARFSRACRVALEKQMMKFKEDFFNLYPGKATICPYTGERIFFTNSDVNHKAPHEFASLVSEFISSNKIDVETVKIHGHEDGIFQDTFDDEMAQRWVAYHNQYAELEVISPTANRILLAKKDGQK